MILETVASAIILAGANYADYSSSQWAIARGGVEINGLLHNHQAPIKIIATAAETLAFAKLNHKSHALAWTWVGVIAGVNLAIARHNQGININEKR